MSRRLSQAMQEAWTDGEMLDALDLRAGGWSASRIGRRLGRSRSSVLARQAVPA